MEQHGRIAGKAQELIQGNGKDYLPIFIPPTVTRDADFAKAFAFFVKYLNHKLPLDFEIQNENIILFKLYFLPDSCHMFCGIEMQS